MLLADLLEISRFDAGAAVLDLEDVNLVDVAHRVVDVDPRAGRAARAPRSSSAPATGRAWPRSTHAGSSGSCATWSPTPSTTPTASDVVVLVDGRRRGDRARRPRPRRRAASPARRRWSSTGSGAPTRPGPAPPAAPGSGLSISLEDAHLHGGWLQAWGEPGGGAQFRLTLPRRAGDRIGAEPAAAGPRRTPAGADGMPRSTRRSPEAGSRWRCCCAALAGRLRRGCPTTVPSRSAPSRQDERPERRRRPSTSPAAARSRASRRPRSSGTSSTR